MAKGSRGRTTGGARRQGGRAGRRQPSKPLIIDVEASDVAAPNSAPAASAPANSDTKPASSGLDEKAAIGAGLMADDAPRAAQASASASVAEPEAANASAPASSATEPASADKAESANDQDTAPAGLAAAAAAGSAKQAGGPSPFYLFAAGLVGGLLALALMFLAQMLGLIAPPNTGLDEQRAALQATEERLAARITALETAEAVSVDAPPAVDLGPLETQVASLGARLDEVSANLAAGDAADAAGVDPDAFRSLLAEATSALSGRVDALEAQIATVSAPESDAGLGDLQSVTAALSDQVAGAQSALSDLSERLAAVEAQGAPAVDSADAAPTAPAPETMARLDALDGLIASNGARLESAEGGVAGLTDTVAGLSSQLSSLTDDVAALGSSMQALADAPAAPAPDPIARLGVALDALTVARDAGQPVAPLVEAAKAAASFESTLSAAFEPLGSVTFPDQLDAG
ncbi:MAG: hypothetical protein KI785_13615, partial [Devosiaceae bacterium]|nr:hypothetical protein [Devosiaceae bacterium MH13]